MRQNVKNQCFGASCISGTLKPFLYGEKYWISLCKSGKDGSKVSAWTTRIEDFMDIQWLITFIQMGRTTLILE